MIAEAIQKIAEFAQRGIKPETTTYGGRNYQAGPHQYVEVKEPAAAPITVHTLAAVVDYLQANKDSLALSALTVHVVNPRLVAVLGPLRADRQREVYLQAAPIAPDPMSTIVGKFLAQEQFVLLVQIVFADSPARAELLRIAGNLTTEKARALVDDGVTQEATIKNGGVRTGGAIIKNPQLLVPNRTFPEVKLEAVPFILRLDGGGDGEMPKVGLFECDNGAWMVDAIEKIGVVLIDKQGADKPAWSLLS